MSTSIIVKQAIPSGSITAIPAKAHAHRALIAAALADSPSSLIISHYSEDIDATITSLQGLGATIEKTSSGVTVTPIPQVDLTHSMDEIALNNTSATKIKNINTSTNTTIQSTKSNLNITNTGTINAHESGTTLRLLLPIGSAISKNTLVTATGHLPERPLEPLKSQLEAHGVSFSASKPPFTMCGPLKGGHFNIVGNVSSQFFSGLLLAAPNMIPTVNSLISPTSETIHTNSTTKKASPKDNIAPVVIHSTTPLQSKDYVELTRKVMDDFGVTTTVSGDGNTFTVPPKQHYQGRQHYAIEGDWSNSAIWIVAAAITGQPITITNLQMNSTQADKRILHIITSAGATINWHTTEWTNTTAKATVASLYSTQPALHCSGRAHIPMTVDLKQCPDLLPVLAALACSIQGESHFINGERLRLKESDRLAAVKELVTTLGGQARIDGDDLHITGTGHLIGGTVHSYKDHRLVMAATLMALISQSPVTITDSDAINKSYPLFFEHWKQLGGQADIVSN